MSGAECPEWGTLLQSSNLLADNTWAPRLAACTALQLLAFPGVAKCSHKMQYRDVPAYVHMMYIDCKILN